MNIKRLLSSTLALTLVAGFALSALPSNAVAQDTAAPKAEPAKKLLSVGDKAPALQFGKWVKGDEVKSFEKGHVYVMEFWATWCGPCRKAIPHVTELAHKYKGKVTFIGASVFESDDKAGKDYATLVTDFVTSQGDKMDYAVAYDTKAGGAGYMATNWLEAAGKNSIPQTFIVDGEGKIAWMGHPMSMEAPLKKALGIATDEAPDMQEQAEQAAASYREFLGALNKSEDAAIAVARKAAEGSMKDNAFALNSFAWELLDKSKFKTGNLDLAYTWATRAAELTKSKDGMILDTLALAEFRKGNIEKAIEVQEKALACIKDSAMANDEMIDEMKGRLAEFKAAKK